MELEISLDETREQYNNVLRSSNNRAQQKKMAFLERNLEQLTHVQRQLVEQNNTLKKEVAIAEKKLSARNERIMSLESLLQESQEKLTAANHRYTVSLALIYHSSRSVLTFIYLQIRGSTHYREGAARSCKGWIQGHAASFLRPHWPVITHCQAPSWGWWGCGCGERQRTDCLVWDTG